MDGDYFNPQDFEPYYENDEHEIQAAVDTLKSKGVTPEMYEKLWESN